MDLGLTHGAYLEIQVLKCLGPISMQWPNNEHIIIFIVILKGLLEDIATRIYCT